MFFFVLISVHVDALFQFPTTHTPFGGVPGCKPPSEGGRLKSLLDQDNGGVWVSGARVGTQVLLAGGHCFFALYLIGVFTNPEKHLRPTIKKRSNMAQKRRHKNSGMLGVWLHLALKCIVFIKKVSFLRYKQHHLIPGPMCPAAWHHPRWGHPAWTESPRSQWNGPSYWSIQTGAAGDLKPSAVICNQHHATRKIVGNKRVTFASTLMKLVCR